MDQNEMEQAYSQYVDSISYEEAGRALYTLTRSAFLAGWEAGSQNQEEKTQPQQK